MVKEPTPDPAAEFAVVEDEPDEDAQRVQALRRRMHRPARQASLDLNDGIDL